MNGSPPIQAFSKARMMAQSRFTEAKAMSSGVGDSGAGGDSWRQQSADATGNNVDAPDNPADQNDTSGQSDLQDQQSGSVNQQTKSDATDQQDAQTTADHKHAQAVKEAKRQKSKQPYAYRPQ